MIRKLAAYDMDGTLLYTPEPEYGIKAYEENTGLKYPHMGWWSKPESLDYNIFDIKPNMAVLSRLNQDNAKSGVQTF